MNIKSKALNKRQIYSLEGVIGTIKALYFDDRSWSIRYLVLDSGGWLPRRQVLVSPHALISAVRQNTPHLAVNLTKKQIEDSPVLGNDQPPSLHFEIACHIYYQWPGFWRGKTRTGMDAVFGVGSHSMPAMANRKFAAAHGEADPHLRNTSTITGHQVQAEDGGLGQVEDFVVDTDNWCIKKLIVTTGHWWNVRRKLLSTRNIDQFGWDQSKVFVNLTREGIRKSPDYSPQSLVQLGE